MKEFDKVGYPRLKGILVERGIKQKSIASKLGISLTSFNNRLNGKGDFSIFQARTICSELGIDSSIFFENYVPYREQNRM